MSTLGDMCPTPRRRKAAALAVGALVVLAGCAQDAPQDYFQPKGENARTINDLWDAIRDAMPKFSATECTNYFTATGYEPE